MKKPNSTQKREICPIFSNLCTKMTAIKCIWGVETKHVQAQLAIEFQTSSSLVVLNGSKRGSLIYEGNEEYYNGDKIVWCHCFEQCGIVIACMEANPSRRFHGCRNYGVIILCVLSLGFVKILVELWLWNGSECRNMVSTNVFCGMIYPYPKKWRI